MDMDSPMPDTIRLATPHAASACCVLQPTLGMLAERIHASLLRDDRSRFDGFEGATRDGLDVV